MSVYLDHNATTPVAPRVLGAMTPWLEQRFGNASSQDHAWGWDAAEAVEEARVAVAAAVGSTSRAVTFTSGATEALNAVIRGYVGFGEWGRKKIVACATEHDAALTPCRHLSQRTGTTLETLGVDEAGRVDLARLAESVERSPGALVVMMAANNESGTVHPLAVIANVVHDAGGLLLCDTTQAVGKLALATSSVRIDFATVSAHKLYGPKGCGALLVRDGLQRYLEPLILGGGQEHGVRGGTLNVPGIVGLGEACRLAQEELEADVARMERLRDRLEDGILSQVPNAWINGDRAARLCNTSNIGFKAVDARALIRDMHDIAVSTRSACSSGEAGPSHVLKAMGLTDEDAYSCVRFSLGRFTTQEEIDYTIEKVVASVQKLRRAKSERA